jgi:hypothetical protein
MVTKNFAIWDRAFSFVVNGDHRHPPTPPLLVEDEVSRTGFRSSQPRVSLQAPPPPEAMGQSGARRTTGSARERLSLEETRHSCTSNAFQVLPAGLPNGTPYQELLKSKSMLSIAETRLTNAKNDYIHKAEDGTEQQ